MSGTGISVDRRRTAPPDPFANYAGNGSPSTLTRAVAADRTDPIPARNPANPRFARSRTGRPHAYPVAACHARAVHFWRAWLICCTVVGLLAWTGAGTALASDSGSAGDQQYVDPFSGSSQGQKAGNSSGSESSSASSPELGLLTEPTATIASASSRTLPYTGFDSWLGGVLDSRWWRSDWPSEESSRFRA